HRVETDPDAPLLPAEDVPAADEELVVEGAHRLPDYRLGVVEVDDHPVPGRAGKLYQYRGGVPVHHGALLGLGEDVRVVKVERGIVEEDRLEPPARAVARPEHPRPNVKDVAARVALGDHHASLPSPRGLLPILGAQILPYKDQSVAYRKVSPPPRPGVDRHVRPVLDAR